MPDRGAGFRLCQACVLWLMISGIACSEVVYEAPDLGTPIVRMEEENLPTSEIQALGHVLLVMAHLPAGAIEGRTRGKAVALAHAVRPLDRAPVMTDFQLRFGRPLDEIPSAVPPSWILAQQIDQDGDGLIRKSEASRRWAALEHLDEDRDGELSAREIDRGRLRPEGRKRIASRGAVLAELRRLEKGILLNRGGPANHVQRLAHYLSDLQIDLGVAPADATDYGEDANWSRVFPDEDGAGGNPTRIRPETQ